MAPVDTVAINSVYIGERIRQLGLKRYWLARAVGVDRRTLRRWLSGQTKSIQSTHFEKLCEHLDCEQAQARLPKSHQLRPSEAQQQAAELICKKNLIEILTPSCQWQLAESIILATVNQQSSKSELAELYNMLCIASWRQSDIPAAKNYLERAVELAVESGHHGAYLRCQLNRATLADFAGRLLESIELYHDVIEQAEAQNKPDVRAAALSNLGCSYFQKGELASAREYQLASLNQYNELNKPLNASIATFGLAEIEIEEGLRTHNNDAFRNAQKLLESSLALARDSLFQRGEADALLYLSWVYALRSEFEKAQSNLEQAQRIFTRLGIRESRILRVEAELELLQGFKSGEAKMQAAYELAGDFLFARAQTAERAFALTRESQWRLRAQQHYEQLSRTDK